MSGARNLKTYRVTAPDFDDAEVTLDVDHAVLTPELATEINQFSGSAMARVRLSEQRNDVVATVIRLFGANAISYFFGTGGADLVTHRVEDSERWTQRVIAAQCEGWPDFKALGIRIKTALVVAPGFLEVQLEEATA